MEIDITSKKMEKYEKPNPFIPYRLEETYSDIWSGTIYNILMQTGELLGTVEYVYHYRNSEGGRREGPFVAKLYRWVDNPKVGVDMRNTILKYGIATIY